MALLTAQPMSINGAAVTLTAANASDTVAPSDRSFLVVQTTGTATTVTTTPPGSYFGQAFANTSGTTPATGIRFFGPLDSRLADPTTNLITLNFSGALTGVTRAIVSM